MNKKGVTLLELIVYMALAALVMVPIAMLMQNSSMTMARDSAHTNLRMSGRDILNIMYDDLKNTGFKLNPRTFSEIYGITYAPNDKSSFMPKDSSYYDGLTVRMAKLHPDGALDTIAPTNNSAAIYEIAYFLQGSNLIRAVSRSGDPQPEKILADNVAALQFQYSEDMTPANVSNQNTAWVNLPTVTGNPSKANIQFIKISIVLKDDKRLAQTKAERQIDVGGDTLKVPAGNLELYELHSIVVPIPNNGL